MVANQLWCRKTIFISTNFLSTHTNAQVSVLTDQVEAQGAKISDLQSSLVEHQQKLDSTEEMLQQVRSCIDLKSEHLTLDLKYQTFDVLPKAENSDIHQETSKDFISILFFYLMRWIMM